MTKKCMFQKILLYLLARALIPDPRSPKTCTPTSQEAYPNTLRRVPRPPNRRTPTPEEAYPDPLRGVPRPPNTRTPTRNRGGREGLVVVLLHRLSLISNFFFLVKHIFWEKKYKKMMIYDKNNVNLSN